MDTNERGDEKEQFIKIACGDTVNATKLNDDEYTISIKTPTSTKQVEFTGLSKEEILKYEKDPQWVKIRWILFVLFWIVWFGMLIAAILLIVLTPKCPAKPRLEWYQKEVFYQIDVSKFQDSNGDGIGDLEGVLSRLDYLSELGVKTLCLYNITKSGSPKNIDERYGDAKTLLKLKKELQSRCMCVFISKVILN